jgi:hypothetical protein
MAEVVPWFARPWPAEGRRHSRGFAVVYLLVAIGGLVSAVLSSSLLPHIIWLLFALTFGYLGVTLWATVRWRENGTRRGP